MLKNNPLKSVPSFLIILFITLQIFFDNLSGVCQNIAIDEHQIKTSGLYFYGQGIEETQEKAKEEARHDLIFMITSNIEVEVKLDANNDLMVDGIEYMFFPRGNKTRALAYILKSKVVEYTDKSKIQVNQIHYEDKINDNEKNDENEPLVTSGETPVENLSKEDTITKNEFSNRQDESQVIITSHESINQYEAQTESEIVKTICKIQNTTELAVFLRDLKGKGLLMYGDSKSMISPEKYYIIVFDPQNREIISFLDKGNTERINLLNNNKVDDFLSTYKNYEIVWIQIF